MKEDTEDYKKVEELVNNILKHLAFIQYYPSESVTKRGYIVFLAMLYISLQPAIAIYENWSYWNFNFRVAAVDNLLLTMGVVCLSIDVLLLSEKFSIILKLTNSKYELYSFDSKTDILRQKENLVRDIISEGIKRAKMTANVLSFFFISSIFVPLSGFFSYLLQLQPVENLPLPFLFYSPFSFSLKITSFIEYLFLSSIELLFMYYTTVLATNVHVLQFLSINNVLGEMKLFHLNAKETDEQFEKLLNSRYNATGSDRETFETNLRSATRKLVAHHQTIFRKVRQVNNGSDFRIFYSNSYMCLQIVFGIFIFLKGEFIYKIKYGMIVITITLLEYIFSENGQRLQDEGEKLRVALYGCSWMGKPTWFTKDLLILMTRNNNLPKFALLNLFTLNRNNVTVVIRGAYSYFNVLNSYSS